jgi:hypothetical protein
MAMSPTDIQGAWLLNLTWELGAEIRVRMMVDPTDKKPGERCGVVEMVLCETSEVEIDLKIDKCPPRVIACDIIKHNTDLERLSAQFSSGTLSANLKDICQMIVCHAVVE